MTPSSKPSVSLSKVPSVKELCERLGFQSASLKETNTFMESTRAWRKSYQTSSGRPGTEILAWNQPQDQLDLEDMAQKFINEKINDIGNGERFWSPNQRWNQDCDIHFPEDRARIVELLKQLFWKQNRYAFNNSQYGHKESEPRDQSREETTPIRQINSTTHVDPPVQVVSAQVDLGSRQSKSPRNPSKSATLSETTHRTTPADNSTTVQIDTPFPEVYEIPDDSDHSHSPTTTFSRSPKRPRPVFRTGESPRKKVKRHLAEALRRTDRKHKIRNLPHAVPDDQVDQLINDAIEIHDRAHNVQLAGAPLTMGSLEQSIPQMEAIGAEPNSRDPIHQVLPVAGGPAPIAPMFASDARKSSSPQSKADGPSNGGNNQSEMQRSSTYEDVVGKSTPTEVLYPPTSEISSPDLPPIHLESTANPVESQEQSQGPSKVSDTFGHVSERIIRKPPKLQTPLQRTDTIEDETKTSTPPPIPPHSSSKTQLAQGAPPQASSSNPRPKTQIPLWIITREPRCTEERWDNGKFLGTPLPAFIEGISKITQRNNIEKVKLTLRAPTFDTKITVFKDAEDSWASAKETFVEKVKEAKAEARAKRQVEQPSFKILIEPFYEEAMPPSGTTDEDEEELDF